MGYTTLNKDEKEEEKNKKYKGNDLRSAALEFICETCEKLRFDEKIEQDEIASEVSKTDRFLTICRWTLTDCAWKMP